MKFICAAIAVFEFYLFEIIIMVYALKTGGHDEVLAKTRTYWRILMFLYFVNSAINPLVYALFKSDIKRSLRRMVHRNRRY